MRRAIALAQELLREAGEPAPVAVGVGTAGQVVPGSGVMAFATAALPGWTGMPVRRRMEQATGLPSFVDNDANAMALGEAVFGAGRGCRYVVGLTVGTGVGGGIVVDGRVYHGVGGLANNIGHVIIDYRGRRQCPCGKYGCLEAYASAPCIVADFLDGIGRRRLRRELGVEPGAVGVKEIAGWAAGDQQEALAAIQRGASFLGVGIATLLNLLNPEVVVIGGGVAQAGEVYFSVVRRVVRERAMPTVAETPVLPAQLGPQANLVGAACLAWQGLADEALP